MDLLFLLNSASLECCFGSASLWLFSFPQSSSSQWLWKSGSSCLVEEEEEEEKKWREGDTASMMMEEGGGEVTNCRKNPQRERRL